MTIVLCRHGQTEQLSFSSTNRSSQQHNRVQGRCLEFGYSGEPCHGHQDQIGQSSSLCYETVTFVFHKTWESVETQRLDPDCTWIRYHPIGNRINGTRPWQGRCGWGGRCRRQGRCRCDRRSCCPQHQSLGEGRRSKASFFGSRAVRGKERALSFGGVSRLAVVSQRNGLRCGRWGH